MVRSVTKLVLRIIWSKEVLGLAIDQKKGNQIYPLTSYYLWPKTKAWEQLQSELDSRPWLPSKHKIEILNFTTEVLNYWKKSRTVKHFEQVLSFFSFNYPQIFNDKSVDGTFIKVIFLNR